jgi:hypothetical protein
MLKEIIPALSSDLGSKPNCLISFFRCIQQINKANRGELTPEELKERQVRSSFQLLWWRFLFYQLL